MKLTLERIVMALIVLYIAGQACVSAVTYLTDALGP
jgi:hypothetical protein